MWTMRSSHNRRVIGGCGRVWVFVAAAAATVCAGPAAAATCEELTKLSLPNSIIASAVTVDAGVSRLPDGTPVHLPAHCRVTGIGQPTPASNIYFYVWLPADWNGKYMQLGQGGLAGSYNPASLALNVRLGYAVAYTDSGHRNNASRASQGAWALGEPELIIDFGYRALKTTTDGAKALIKAHYGNAPRWSYFVGCSDGGREALMEAQRYPDDFDGILAGAPANHWTRHFAGFVWNVQALYKDPASLIPQHKLPMIQAASVAACDALDGLQDGLVDDPRRCRFDPATLLCPGADAGNCLTAPQVDALKKVMSGPKNPRTGEQIFPGYFLHTAAYGHGDGEWTRWLLPSPGGDRAVQLEYAEQFFKNFVFDDLRYDLLTFDFDKDVAATDNKPISGEPLASVMNSYNPDLAPFKSRGGKLIQYHGWEDMAIAAEVSTIYYQRVLDAQRGGTNGNGASTEDFYRLFMVPGMQHCGGGPGPNVFGQRRSSTSSLPPQSDAEHDIFVALERWVEQGIAPTRIIATKYFLDEPSRGVERTRPLCPYPQVARYTGSGSIDDAANFTCVNPKP